MTTATLARFVVALAIVAAGWFGAPWVSRFVRDLLETTPLDPRIRTTLLRLVRPLVGLTAFVSALEYLDIDLSTIAAMAGAVTLAVGFTLQPALSNLATGALLVTLRPYREGDWIECSNGEHGTVIEQGPFALVLRRLDGVVVTIPNNVAFASPIRNHTHRGHRRLEISFVLDHDADLALAQQLVKDVMRSDVGLVDVPETGVLVANEDRGVRLTIRAWCEPASYPVVASRLSEDALGALRLAGIPLAARNFQPGMVVR